jgi:hypothetical protein
MIYTRRLILCAAILASIGSLTMAEAQTANYKTINVSAGVEARLGYHAAGDRKTCTILSAPEVSVYLSPEHGALSIRDVQVTTSRFVGCGIGTFPGKAVYYTPAAGFVGSDTAAYRVTRRDGKVTTFAITLVVGAAQPAVTK